MTSQEILPDGWYLDEKNDKIDRWYYQGRKTRTTRPAQGGAVRAETAGVLADGAAKGTNWPLLVALLMAILGFLIAAFTSVSLLSGMDQVYLGAAVAIGGAVVAWAGKVHIATRVICTILAVLAVAIAADDQRQLNDRRDQLQQILNTP